VPLSPLPPPTFRSPPVRSFYAVDTERQLNPFTVARYGVGSAAAAEQQVASQAFQQHQQVYQPPAGQPPPGGQGMLQQRQFGAQ
jgi:hypothetical protein